MKFILLLPICVASFLFLSVVAHAEAEEVRRPTWIERLFGAKDPETAKEGNDQASNKEAAVSDGSEKRVKGEASSSRKFNAEERKILEDWQRGNAEWKKSDKPLPPGLRKKVQRGGELPPGWKKKLEVGVILDSELDDQARSLPEEVLARLPESAVGTEVLEIGGEIVRVVENTREIIDIIRRRVEGESE